MNRQFEQITAIYTRVDSGKYDMEAAISQQKAALSEYAQRHSLTNIRIYSDCGFSAYDETRPAFAKLETDIRSGKVAVLSRPASARLSSVVNRSSTDASSTFFALLFKFQHLLGQICVALRYFAAWVMGENAPALRAGFLCPDRMGNLCAEYLDFAAVGFPQQAVNVKSFLKIVKKYTEPTELTPAILREFVEKVVVHAPDKSSGHRVQRIDVHYTFIGEIDLSPEYSKYEKETTA